MVRRERKELITKIPGIKLDINTTPEDLTLAD